MDNRRAKLIADVIKHLESLDADELGGKMAPEVMAEEVMEPPMGDEGPMVAAMDGAEVADEDAVDDEELEELEKLSS